MKFYRLSGATFYDCNNTDHILSLFNISWIIKYLCLRNMEPLSKRHLNAVEMLKCYKNAKYEAGDEQT